MGIFDGYLIMSDFDRTLCNSGVIPAANSEAIRHFQNEGGIFSLSSGRWPEFIVLWKEFFVPNGICAMMNGNILCSSDGKTVYFEETMDRISSLEFVKTVMNACPRLDHVRFHGKNDSVCMYHENTFTLENVPDPLYKFVFLTPDETSDEYTNTIKTLATGKYLVARSWINGIEIQNAGTGKGNAVSLLRNIYGDKIHTVVAVGDYENDIEMLKAADIGYAVDNALPSVKAAADKITVDCSLGAVAAVINDLENGILNKEK